MGHLDNHMICLQIILPASDGHPLIKSAFYAKSEKVKFLIFNEDDRQY